MSSLMQRGEERGKCSIGVGFLGWKCFGALRHTLDAQHTYHASLNKTGNFQSKQAQQHADALLVVSWAVVLIWYKRGRGNVGGQQEVQWGPQCGQGAGASRLVRGLESPWAGGVRCIEGSTRGSAT
jgi:hypothetical protein